MRLKQVLFSSLFLSAGLVACTNEEFAEMQTPSVDVENAISLGEGYTITGSKVAETPATKSYFELAGGVKAYWEETDVIGAAWYNMVEKINEETGLVENSAEINTNHKYFSNTDFNWLEFVNGNKASARFKAETNVMAGAYVLYYPFDENVKQVSEEIPVVREFPITVDLTEGNEFNTVSERMFSYGVAAFVPGGEQTGHFELGQVPVLFGLRFGAEKLQLVDLQNNPLVIDRIVFEAYDATGNSVLTEAGSIKPTQLTNTDYNAYIEWLAEDDATKKNPLPAAKYEGDATKTVGHYTIVLNNSDQPAYRIDALDEEGLTEGRIVFSALPFIKAASKVVVKIITNNGINLSKTYTDAASLAIFNNATKEGTAVFNDIYVDSQTNDQTIYTKDQFLAQWNAAIKNQATTTLTIADPVMLEDMTLSTPDMNRANITIKKYDQNNADLTVGGIELEGYGSLKIESSVIVKGNVVSGSNSRLEITGEVEANDIRVGGWANLTVNKMNSLTIDDSGEVTLAIADGAKRADIGGINIMGEGELTMNGGFINSIEGGENAITLGGKAVTNYGNFNGALAGTGEFINEGTFNGTVASNVKFTNNAGATATIANTAAATGVKLVNAAKTVDEAAGVVNIQNADRVSLTLVSGSTNNGVINVKSGTMTGAYANNEAGRIYVEADATVSVGRGQTVTNTGWIVLNDVDANLASFTKGVGSNGYNTALSVKEAADLSSRGDAVWFWIDNNITIAQTVHDAYINSNVTLSTGAELTGYTRITENVAFNLAESVNSLTVNVNSLSVTGHLTIADGIKLSGKVTSNADFQHITGDLSGLTVQP